MNAKAISLATSLLWILPLQASDLLTDVLSELPKAREDYKRLTTLIQGHKKNTFVSNTDIDQYIAASGGAPIPEAHRKQMIKTFGGTTSSQEVDVKLKNGFAREEVSYYPLPGTLPPTFTVLLANPKYSAHLSRSSPDAEWVLQTQRDDPNFKEFRVPGLREPIIEHVRNGLLGNYQYRSKFIEEWFEDPTLEISATEIEREGKKLVRLTIQSKAADNDEPSESEKFLNGWVELDPSAGWHLTSSLEIYRETKNYYRRRTTTRSYRIASKGVWLPLRSVYVLEHHKDLEFKNSFGREEGTLDYDLTIPKDIPDLDFTLTAFGLPEPVGVHWDKPTPRYVWIFLAAAGCGLFALLFRWLAKRNTDIPKTT